MDQQEWAAVYDAHAERLHHLGVLLAGPADAHDLVADAVLRAIGSRQWPTVESPGAYLAQTLVQLAEDGRRRSTRRRLREARSARLSPVDRFSSAPDTEAALVVRRALSTLSPTQMAVVYLHYWEDLTLDRVATELGVTPGTIRKQLDRAKRRLRTQLPQSPEED